MRRKGIVFGTLALGVTVALAITACSGGAKSTGSGFEACGKHPTTCNSGDRKDGGELTWAISAGWDSWNKNRAKGNSVYLAEAVQGILPQIGHFNPDGKWWWSRDTLKAKPKLVSKNPQAWKYELRDDAKWSDGTPIGVDDFIWHWYSLTSDKSKCGDCDPAATSYGDEVKSITKDSSGAIVVTLKKGSYDPDWLTKNTITYPAHIADKHGKGWKTDPKAMAESSKWFSDNQPDYSGGPYMIKSAKIGQKETLVPNPRWYGKIKPTLDKLNLLVVSSQQDMLKALDNGELDGAAPESLDPDVSEQATGDTGIRSNLAPGPGWEHFDLNVTNKWLKDVKLREAMLTAIDVDDVNKRTYGQLTKVKRRDNYLFNQKSPYFKDTFAGSSMGTGDIAKAKKMLSAAGYKLSGGKLTKDGKQVGPFTYRYLEGHAMRKTTSELVQGYLGKIGIKANIKTIAASQLGTVLDKSDFDIVEFGWSTDPAFTTAPQQFWDSKSPSNFGRNSDKKVDTAIAKVHSTVDLKEAAGFANDAGSLVAKDAYILPVVTTPVLIVTSKKVVNVRDNWASQIRALYNMEEWGIKK
ncbi:MAG TPA: ABC transporter family substrate-binding protein [Stackebrandtia sp.]|jgi:peptide/nickel transport system substrate-binding protein|uniref:ABC transporter family substrate-binding protein n=1 Tax=Stackebrandtia sp. TaxID=2023065 RepID=UPI002D6361E1|nr:ABC transporter family substrate-binding protein [Stackebrandtia sp.]HZE41003.1 ABC transporter family substrate-binding protein [Stackebrandtia sp.]